MPWKRTRACDVRRFPYQRLRGPALRILGSAVATSLEAYNRTDLEQAATPLRAMAVR